MRLGFTGTKQGLSWSQRETLSKYVNQVRPEIEVARHGDCIGSDFQFHIFCIDVKVPELIIHPPSDPKYRAYAHLIYSAPETKITVLPEEPYLDRDHAMVDGIDYLVVCPITSEEFLRSGTWATYRYAKKKSVPHLIIYPDGTTNER